MNYKTTLLVLVIGGVVVGINFLANHFAEEDRAESEAVWEGECVPQGLVEAGNKVALVATCGEQDITTKSTSAILHYDKHREAKIHCVIFEAGNNKCSPPEGAT